MANEMEDKDILDFVENSLVLSHEFAQKVASLEDTLGKHTVADKDIVIKLASAGVIDKLNATYLTNMAGKDKTGFANRLVELLTSNAEAAAKQAAAPSPYELDTRSTVTRAVKQGEAETQFDARIEALATRIG